VRTYETVFILDPDMTEDETEKAIKRVQTLIEGQKGKIALMDRWGKRKLAYRVKKKIKGNYVRVVYYGEPKIVAILERNLRIMEETLKFLTINLAATEIEITTEEKREEERELGAPLGPRAEASDGTGPVFEKEDSPDVPSDDDEIEEPAEPKE
jgi:small subunit ribosomal protein S6